MMRRSVSALASITLASATLGAQDRVLREGKPGAVGRSAARLERAAGTLEEETSGRRVKPILAMARARKGLDPDPLGAFPKSGDYRRILEERSAVAGAPAAPKRPAKK